MKRQTVQLPDHVASVLTELAHRSHVSEAEIVRWALLTFKAAVDEATDVGYVKLFLESEYIRGERSA